MSYRFRKNGTIPDLGLGGHDTKRIGQRKFQP
jgi:hypothetical protein